MGHKKKRLPLYYLKYITIKCIWALVKSDIKVSDITKFCISKIADFESFVY